MLTLKVSNDYDSEDHRVELPRCTRGRQAWRHVTPLCFYPPPLTGLVLGRQINDKAALLVGWATLRAATSKPCRENCFSWTAMRTSTCQPASSSRLKSFPPSQ